MMTNTSIAGPSTDLRLASKLCIGMDDENIIVIIVLLKASLKRERGLGIEEEFGQGEESRQGRGLDRR